MALDESALSLTARQLRKLLYENIDGVDEPSIFIGTPKQADTSGNLHYLNLFFYRIEPAGHPADARAADPLFVRIRCLLTAFAHNSSDKGKKVSEGENDLRLLGAAMGVLHGHPTILIPSEQQPVARVEIIPISLKGEELERLWSAQGNEVSYRPSVAYELALVPIPLVIPKDSRPKAGAIEGSATPGPMPPSGWVPRLWFETPEGPRPSLLRPPKSKIEVSISGAAGGAVVLRWSQLRANADDWSAPVELAPKALGQDGRATVQLQKKLFNEPGQTLIHAHREGDASRAASSPVLVTIAAGVDA